MWIFLKTKTYELPPKLKCYEITIFLMHEYKNTLILNASTFKVLP